MKLYTLLFSILMLVNGKPTLAADIKTNDELAIYVCEKYSEEDCQDAKKFMTIIESRAAAKRIVKQLSGSLKLVADAQVHFSKKTKVIYVNLEDLQNSIYVKSQTTYTRSGQFSAWKKQG